MELTAVAAWLNQTFAAADAAVAQFAFSLHNSALGGFFDWLFPSVTVLGDGGVFFIIVGVLLLLFARTRKGGASILIGLLFGLLITNLALKTSIARPRPYADEMSMFYEFWQTIGHGLESEFSFPSGHSTASFAACTAFFWAGNRRYSWCAFILSAMVAFSRIYIHVHYFSDVIAGTIVGFISGTLAYLLIKWIFDKLQNIDHPVPRFLTNASLSNLFKKKQV